MRKPKVLLYSTLGPFPFWAGSENLWFDFVCDENVRAKVDFHIMLADSPVTRLKAERLKAIGITVGFYEHFNVKAVKRNIYKVWDKITVKPFSTIPWYNQINKDDYDLVFFNIAVTNDILELRYATELCRKRRIPYWLLLQLCGEGFFLGDEREWIDFTDISTSAKRFVFISQRNRDVVERAIGQKLMNGFNSYNSIKPEVILRAKQLGKENPLGENGKTKFYSLARFSPLVKGQPLILEAFSDQKWRNRDWELSYVGVSDYGISYLEKLIKFYGIKRDLIKLKHHTENVLDEICKHDILLMPSAAEGTPFAMIESMACFRPALGTDVGGISELIFDQKTGWLCKTNAISEISTRLEDLWSDKPKWRDYGINAQKLIEEKFSQNQSFEKLLTSLLNDVN